MSVPGVESLGRISIIHVINTGSELSNQMNVYDYKSISVSTRQSKCDRRASYTRGN